MLAMLLTRRRPEDATTGEVAAAGHGSPRALGSAAGTWSDQNDLRDISVVTLIRSMSGANRDRNGSG